jgi:hypothetical protein
LDWFIYRRTKVNTNIYNTFFWHSFWYLELGIFEVEL